MATDPTPAPLTPEQIAADEAICRAQIRLVWSEADNRFVEVQEGFVIAARDRLPVYIAAVKAAQAREADLTRERERSKQLEAALDVCIGTMDGLEDWIGDTSYFSTAAERRKHEVRTALKQARKARGA